MMKPRCKDSRPCFARKDGHCVCLISTYPDGKCPFCKPEMEVTNGVYYPFVPKTEVRANE